MKPPFTREARVAVLLALTAAAIVAVALHAPIPQPTGYHAFADQRRLIGVPNFWNVLSNLPFLLVGVAGLKELFTRNLPGAIASMRLAYLCMFGGIVLVAFGSGYYHLAPNDDSLTYDRLPMTVVFMSFFAIVLGEHLDPRLAMRLLVPLLLAGVASVVYWHLTEQAGRGDLRPYAIVQFLPMILIPLILLMFPSRLSHVWMLWALLGAYVIAKLLEDADRAVFSLGHLTGGHALKHVAAAGGLYIFLLAIRVRHPITPRTSDPPSSTRSS